METEKSQGKSITEEIMAENNNTFANTIDSLMKSLEGFASGKTVVGEPITLGDTTLLPIVDLSFGMGAGYFLGDRKKNTGGGVGAKISPSAVLVLKNGTTRMVNIKNQDGIERIIDMVPDFVNRFMDSREEKSLTPREKRARAAAKEEAAEELKEMLNINPDE